MAVLLEADSLQVTMTHRALAGHGETRGHAAGRDPQDEEVMGPT